MSVKVNFKYLISNLYFFLYKFTKIDVNLFQVPPFIAIAGYCLEW